MVMDQQDVQGHGQGQHQDPSQPPVAPVNFPPSPSTVGLEFVRQYYTLLSQKPLHLHRFYAQNSSYIHGGLENGRITEPVKGQQEIHQKIMQLNFRDCKTKIHQVDSHSTIGDGVVVQVSGEISNNGMPMRRFMQTFVLAPQNPNKYYVHNDIFRYQDEVFVDREEVNSHTNNTSSSEESIEASTTNGGAKYETPQGPTLGGSKPPGMPTSVPNHPGRPTVSLVEADKKRDEVEEIEAKAEPTSEAKEAEPEPQEAYEDFQEKGERKEPEGESESAAPAEMTYASRLKLQSNSAKPPPTPSGPKVEPKEAPKFRPPSASGPPPTAGPQGGPGARGAPGASGGRGGGRSERFGSTSREDETGGNQHVGERRRLQSSNSNPPGVGQPQAERVDRGLTSNYPDSQQVFVGNLPNNCTEQELEKLFSTFGKVAEIRINSNKSGSQQKMTPAGKSVPGFGFVAFEDEASVANCLSAKPLLLNNSHRLNVEEKKNKFQMRSENAGGSGSDRGGRGGGPSFDRGSQEHLMGMGRGGIGERGGRGGSRGGGQGRGGGHGGPSGGPKLSGGPNGPFKKRPNQSFGGGNNN